MNNILRYIWFGIMSNCVMVVDSDKKNIIGLISRCGNRNTMGNLVSKRVKQLVQVTSFKFNYTEFDVCEDNIFLIQNIVDIFLNNTWYDQKIDYPEASKLTVKYIISFMPEQMQNQLIKIISAFDTDIFILPLTEPTVESAWMFNKNKQNEDSYLQTQNVIATIVKRFYWNYFSFIEIVGPGKEMDVERLQLLKNDGACFHYNTVNINDVKNLTKTLTTTINTKLVFIFGNAELINIFINRTFDRYDKMYFIIMTPHQAPRGIHGLNDYTLVSQALNQKRTIKWLKYQNSTDNHCLQVVQNKSNDKDDYCYKYLSVYNKYLPTRISNYLLPKIYGRNGSKVIQYSKGKPFLKTTLQEIDIYKINMSNMINYTSCPRCVSCHCKSQEVQEVSLPNFKKSFVNVCTSCNKNFYLDGERHCAKCQEGKISNKNQSSCYDPIKHYHPHIICYVINFIGLILTLATIFVYKKYKDTPVVRSSDYNLSIIQLSFLLALFILAPVISTLRPSKILCGTRPYIFGTVVLSIVSIMVCKAEKVLIIFGTKSRLTKKDLFDIKIRQIAIFGVLVTIGSIIMSVSWEFSQQINQILDSQDSQYIFYTRHCKSDKSINYEIIYCIVLLLIAIFQGYRGRKLPANFNEGNSIIVGGSIAAFSLVFVVWFIYSGKHQQHLISIVWGFIAASMIFLLLAMYAQKLFIILFKPEKNTREHHLMLMLINSRRRIDNLLHKRKQLASVYVLGDSSPILIKSERAKVVEKETLL